MRSSFLLRYLKAILIRTIKKPLFIIILLLIPIMGVLYINQTEYAGAPKVCLYANNPDAVTETVFYDLENSDCSFDFYIASSQQQLENDILAGAAECGYVFPDDMETRLLIGMTNGIIDTYVSSSSTIKNTVNETVYAALYKEYCFIVMADYIKKDSDINSLDLTITQDYLRQIYELRRTDGSTFSFDIEGAFTEYTKTTEKISMHLFIGMIGILLLLSGLMGLLSYSKDCNENVLMNLHNKDHFTASLCNILIPLFFSGIAGAITLALIGYFNSIISIFIYIFYIVAIIVLCLILKPLMRYRMVVLMLIPFYLIGCFVLTPIFIDLSIYLNFLKIIRFIFIPNILFLFH
ncbi:MAG: ABC transporter permease [Lachnospiraceae bacterium]|nr:ABC transporter permease [Candidatus Merdinaster equi]